AVYRCADPYGVAPQLMGRPTSMPVTLKPLGDRVVVKPKPKDEMTSSGIVLPDTASEKPQEGSVLSVGPGRVLDSGKRVEMDVQVGDSGRLVKSAGTEDKLTGVG